MLRSAVVCFICVMLLTSSTYAWYSELVPSDGNDDNPQVEFHWTNTYNAPLEKWKSVELFGANDGSATTEVMFDYDKWEPGHAQVRYLEFEVKI